MKRETYIYYPELGEGDTPEAPDAGYRKLYPKDDGFYSMDSNGNEVRLEGVIVYDDGVALEQKAILEVGRPLRAYQEEDRIILTIDTGGDDDDDDEGMLMHGNKAHYEDYVTQEDIDFHADLTEGVHGLDTIWDAIDNLASTHSTIRGVTKTDEAETTVVAANRTYIADTTTAHVGFVLPAAEENRGVDFVFRRGEGTNAMTVYRSGDDVIDHDGEEWLGLEIDAPGWVVLQSDGSKWYVVMDSGNVNEAV